MRRLKQAGVKIGLGTDCSGGFSPSMLNSMRMAVMASNTLTFKDPSYAPLQFTDALYLATLGGAGLLERKDLGSLDCGKKADLLLVDMNGKRIEEGLISVLLTFNLFLTLIYSPIQHPTVWKREFRGHREQVCVSV